jgi:alpha-tubulin suppressor-like RCC1 family protein
MVALLVVCGCTRPATALVVQIDSDLPVPDALETVRVETLSPQGAPIASRDFRLGGALQVPFSFTVVPADEARLAVRLRVTARGRDGVAFAREWASEFVPEETRFVGLFLSARCRTTRCPATQTCGDTGDCVSVAVSPGALVSFVPGLDRARDAAVADAPPDAALDAPTDVALDVVSEAPLDVAFDAPLDRPVDVGLDAARDVPTDVARDGGFDVATDTGTDAGAGMGFDTGSDAGLVRLPRGVAMGDGHTCAIRWGNAVYCWGDNTYGQLGVEPLTVTSVSVPTVIPALTRRAWAMVVAGHNHTCVLPAGAGGTTPICWGDNAGGQVDPGARTQAVRATPREVPMDARFVSLCAGQRHTCGVRSDGAVQCWGSNRFGQVHPAEARNEFALGTPISFAGGSRAEEVGCGQSHTCARLNNGQVWCWGDNLRGQLGVGDLMPRATPTPVGVGMSAVQLAVGGRHTCVRTADDVRCWGDTDRAQVLPSPSETPRPTPYVINRGAILNPRTVVAGQHHTCVVTSDRLVRCWGDNRALQLGIQRVSYTVAVPGAGTVVGVVDAESLAAGVASTCATLRDGTMRCWGRNTGGQLGDGSLPARATPRLVPGLGDVIAVATSDKNTCAVDAQRAVWCWGANDNGQLGNGGLGPTAPRPDRLLPSPVPQRVVNAFDAPIVADALGLGIDMACARTGSSVACWGDNSYSQLAQADLRDQPVAVNVRLLQVSDLAVGATHVCAVADNDTNGTAEVYCWGANLFGQRGDSSTTTNINQPTMVAGTAGARTVAAAFNHTVMQTGAGAGAVRGWGSNAAGQLSATPSTTGSAVTINLPASVYQFALGVGHSCARQLDSAGAVYCWGNNEFGQTGRPVAATTPVMLVPNVNAAAGLIAQAGATCVLDATAVRCWGKNQLGQLGVEGMAQSYLPVRPTFPGPVVRLGAATNANHACAIVGRSAGATSGRLYCWGSNSHGQLGDGTCGRTECAPTRVLIFP